MIKFPIKALVFLITNKSDVYLTNIIHAGDTILKCSFIYKQFIIQADYGSPKKIWLKMVDEMVLDRESIIGYTRVTDDGLIKEYNNDASKSDFIGLKNELVVQENIETENYKGYLQ